jgi:AraC-like DNA-binding protein
MIVQCPHCGGTAAINGLGRKAFNMPVTRVCDASQLNRSVITAANELGCSRAYIYKVLKAEGLTPAGIIKGLATKDNRLLHKGAETD